MSSNPKKIKLDLSATSKLLPLLSDDLLQDTPLTKVFVGRIKDLKTTSKVVVTLNSCLPIPELAHLKRIKAKEVILLPSERISKDEIQCLLKSRGFDTDLLCDEFRLVKVARVPPRTRRQYLKVLELWPCNFHPDKYIEKLSTNTLFSSSEIEKHEYYMRMAILVATQAKQLKLSIRASGVVIVDPKIDSAVAFGFSDTQNNPCKHPPMVAIDNVAKTQSGNTADQLDLSGFHPELLNYVKIKFPDAIFGASKFKRKNELIEPTDGPYLCTGYYAYCTHEPCIMCAMGLVHSRINRVFYGVSSSNGGLGTLCKIHTVKNLNHHYEVFAKLFEQECGLL
ncbi:probable inactive tRNA-specific adenosine deaminase-like protein 3 [Euwallacea fornicatus]|uniref:probable inactive tRNA-specific adenosine deaminase-like protein 3 n=1 Tax=Euwallacea fornicatus TaxID=995702 RepID=UPI00338DD129